MIASLVCAVVLAVVVWLVCAHAGLPFIVALVLTLLGAFVGWVTGPRVAASLERAHTR